MSAAHATTGSVAVPATVQPETSPDERPAGTSVVARAWARVDALPLRTRLVATIAALLGVGLLATGIATQAYLSRFLVQQVDDQLVQTAHDMPRLSQTIFGADPGPSNYFVHVRLTDVAGSESEGAARTVVWAPMVQRFGTPVIPELTPAQAEDRAGEPFTVRSQGGAAPAQWRVVAFPIQVNLPQGAVTVTHDAIAVVATPLSGVHEATRVLARTLIGVGAGIILLGAVAAWLLVRRALRPLEEIETTAAAIAAGDYTRRVTAAPPTTEVGSLSASLNAMLAQIEQAFGAREESERRMRRFVSDASHELRTPLATIRGYGELYRMGALDAPEKVDDTMGRVEDAARRMGLLVNDLLVLARLDEGRPLRADRVDLAAMADDAAQDLVALDPTRSVRVVGLTSDAPPAALVVTGDGDRLRQVLTNLVGNVARHTPAGSAAELALGTVADPADATRASAVVEVRDHGPGVTPEQAERMFERFYRADSSRTRESGGSGLGLAIVAAIVGSHGGHVTTRTPEDGGLVVRVELPLAGGRPTTAAATDGSTGGFTPTA